MTAYGPLAYAYDVLTGDVPYAAFLAYYQKIFSENTGEYRLLLDLCCGTGTLTCALAESGYDMIGADASPEMLSVAVQKSTEKGVSPLFLCQRAEELDLYGTVDAAVSSLDSFNYLAREDLPAVLERLRLFIRPNGLLIFDIRSARWLRSLDGSTSVDENDELLCLWRADLEEKREALLYGLDLFTRRGSLWERRREEHVEYLYEVDELIKVLTQADFSVLKVDKNGPQGELGRIFFTCRRNP